MAPPIIPSVYRIRQQWQRLRLKLRGAEEPRIREFYTSDFIILDGALCKVFWKVENAWRLTLEPVAVPGGYAALDVTGRIYLDIVANARHHTLYLHADGVNGQRVSQLLDLRPLPVHLSIPSPVLTRRTRPTLPLTAEAGELRWSPDAWQPLAKVPGLQELPNPETELRLSPAYQAAAQQLERLLSRLSPAMTSLDAPLALLAARLEQLRQTESTAQAQAVGRLALPE